MGGGGSGGGTSTNTVTQTQQIPAYEQQFSQANQNLAQSLAAQPYPTYGAPLLANFNPAQFQGMAAAQNAAGAYRPDLAAAEGVTQGGLNSTNQANFANAASNAAAMGMNGTPVYGAMNAAAGQVGNALAGGQNVYNAANAASGQLGNTLAQGQNVYNAANAASGLIGQSLGRSANQPGVINSYMNPYLQASLNPQIANLNQEIGMQQLQNNAGASQAGAFGDARQGVGQGLTNYYGDQALNQLVSQGYNTAFNNAQSAAQQQQAFGLQGAGQMANLGQLGLGEQGIGMQGVNALANLGQLGLGQEQVGLTGANTLANLGQLGLGEQQAQLSGGSLLGNLGQQALAQQGLQLQGGQQLAGLGGLQQQLGLTGANALYGTGALQQQQQQQALNLAYQQFQNQVQWPYQQLNVRESALSNSPYNITNQTTLPNANQLASGVGAFGSLAGLLGSLGGNSNGNLAPFGGQALQQ